MEAIPFILGKGSGKLLIKIAREHITEELNPTRAMDLLRDTLPGISDRMALNLLSGVYILGESDDGRELVAELYNPLTHVSYPLWKISGWVEFKHRQLGNQAKEYLRTLKAVKADIKSSRGTLQISVGYKSLMNYFAGGDPEDIMQGDTDGRIVRIKYAVTGIRAFLARAYQTNDVIGWLASNFPGAIPIVFHTLPGEVRELAVSMTGLVSGTDELPGVIRKQEFGLRMLDRFIETELRADEEVKTTIVPVSITDGYTAGWLAPTGEYYAMSGETANFLHNKIADRILDARIIPWGGIRQDGGKRMENPDRWLEENGWVKIHGDLILYAGYARHICKKNGPIPLTERQVEALCNYGTECCGGILSLGTPGNRVRVSRLRATEAPMLHHYFDR